MLKVNSGFIFSVMGGDEGSKEGEENSQLLVALRLLFSQTVGVAFEFY